MGFNIPDLTKITWQFNTALVGAMFSIFALIYNEKFIYYGFITFLYGVIGHILDLLIGQIENNQTKFLWFFIAQIALVIAWVSLLLLIY